MRCGRGKFSAAGGRFVAGCMAAAVCLIGGAEARAQRVLGLDISAWQGDISQTTWNNIQRVENRKFVFIRSSRGGTTGFYNQSNPSNSNPPGQNTLSQRYDDPFFVQNIRRATSAGIFAGSYHFSRPDIIESTLNSNGIANSGRDEADHFLQMAGAWMRPGYLLPVHDLEAGDGVRSDNAMAQFAIDFSHRIYEVMGIRPAIYLNGNYAQNVLGTASSSLRDQVVAAYPTLWTARWPNQSNPDAIDVQNGHPKDSFAGIYGPWDDGGVTHPWNFWQYASTGRLASFNNGNSNLDMNVSQGDIEYLKDFLVPALWVHDSDGDWALLDNWNSGQPPTQPVTGPGQVPPVGPQVLPSPRLPGAAGSAVTSGRHDTVILDRPQADIAVTLSTGTYNIRKLFVREALEIVGGALTVNYDPTYSSDTINYPHALRSGPVSAQFSAPVRLAGSGSLSVHTLQVDAGQSFTLQGGSLSFRQLILTRDNVTPAQLRVTGDVQIQPLNGGTATLSAGNGTGSQGRVDLSGGNRFFDVADGAAAIDLDIRVLISNGGLVKTGSGTMALTGGLDYLGDTAVHEGALRLFSPQLYDFSDLHLQSSASLNLDYAQSLDVVRSFFIDGISQPVGIWGAVGSGAPFTTPLITGNGRLLVTAHQATGDFDGDGIWDCRDIDGLVAAIVAGNHHGLFDLTGDGLVNHDDLTAWRAAAGAVNLPSGAAYLPGDANLDGTVDGSDFNQWNAHKFTATAAWCAGDFSADGLVDVSDFAIWNSQKFTSSAGLAAVPEPQFLGWCFGLLTFAGGLRRSLHRKRPWARK